MVTLPYQPEPQAQLDTLLAFLGINPGTTSDLQLNLVRSSRWIELNDIAPDDYRYDAAQAELATMTEWQRNVRELTWDELSVDQQGNRLRVPRRAVVQVDHR